MLDDPFLLFCGLVILGLGIVVLIVVRINYHRAKRGKVFRSFSRKSSRFSPNRNGRRRHRRKRRHSRDGSSMDFNDNNDFMDYRG